MFPGSMDLLETRRLCNRAEAAIAQLEEAGDPEALELRAELEINEDILWFVDDLVTELM